MYYVHKKARCEPKVATFRIKTLPFLRVIRLTVELPDRSIDR